MNWLNKFWLKFLDILPIIFGTLVCIILILLGLVVVVGLFELLVYMIGGM